MAYARRGSGRLAEPLRPARQVAGGVLSEDPPVNRLSAPGRALRGPDRVAPGTAGRRPGRRPRRRRPPGYGRGGPASRMAKFESNDLDKDCEIRSADIRRESAMSRTDFSTSSLALYSSIICMSCAHEMGIHPKLHGAQRFARDRSGAVVSGQRCPPPTYGAALFWSTRCWSTPR